MSHFILRLAYCRTEELRRWLLAQESALLKYRLSLTTDGSALATVLPEAKLLSPKEQEALWPLLWAATPSLNGSGSSKTTATMVSQSNTKIYAIPFAHALDMVSTRQVLVKGGMAYIPQSKLLNLVTAKFRTTLSRQLVLLAQMPRNAGAVRVQDLLDNLATVSSKQDDDYANARSNELTPQNVEKHVRHMPLCMVQLQWGLQKDKKLKHWGRLQYGLFLKGAGLSLEDALVYFERMFTTTQNFSKEYAYNIRHMYGKEGKRASYPPKNCSKIILGTPPNAGEHHGCPYKHGTVQYVTHMLTQLGMGPTERGAIRNLQESKQYQLACVKHFEVAHPNATGSAGVNLDNVGNHPNAWFQSSVSYAKQHDSKESSNADAAAESPSTTTANAADKMDTSPLVTVSP
jgi:DNA primase large subunit